MAVGVCPVAIHRPTPTPPKDNPNPPNPKPSLQFTKTRQEQGKTHVSEKGDLYTSGAPMTKRMFLDLRTVTRAMPGTCFMPSFCTALRAFFSERDCFPPLPPAAPPSCGLWFGRFGLVYGWGGW